MDLDSNVSPHIVVDLSTPGCFGQFIDKSIDICIFHRCYFHTKEIDAITIRITTYSQS